jgi:hypothetical protein
MIHIYRQGGSYLFKYQYINIIRVSIAYKLDKAVIMSSTIAIRGFIGSCRAYWSPLECGEEKSRICDTLSCQLSVLVQSVQEIDALKVELVPP